MMAKRQVRTVGAWLRTLAPRDLAREFSQLRAQTANKNATLPLGSAWLFRNDESIDLTQADYRLNRRDR